ncbi:hypothetical protein D3C73_1328570 [compost metagenome]
MELFEDNVTHGHRQRAVSALLRCQPLIAQLGNFRVVRRNSDGLGAFIADFGKEVSIGRTGLRNVGAPGNDIAGVIPVGGFRHVGLLAPGHR